jgi:hypothetical protein
MQQVIASKARESWATGLGKIDSAYFTVENVKKL